MTQTWSPYNLRVLHIMPRMLRNQRIKIRKISLGKSVFSCFHPKCLYKPHGWSAQIAIGVTVYFFGGWKPSHPNRRIWLFIFHYAKTIITYEKQYQPVESKERGLPFNWAEDGNRTRSCVLEVCRQALKACVLPLHHFRIWPLSSGRGAGVR